jgi:hypothetical protein
VKFRSLAAVVIMVAASLAVTAVPAAAAAPVIEHHVLSSLNSVRVGDADDERVMAVLNASTGNNAPLIQYKYSPQVPNNDRMVLEFQGDVVRIKPEHTYTADGNPHNDKCLAVKNNDGGLNIPIVNATCSYDSINNDVWFWQIFIDVSTRRGAYEFKNQAHGTCIVVQNASNANGAALITHQCVGDNSLWAY